MEIHQDEGAARLPLPVRLPPPVNPARSLAIKVRDYFHSLWSNVTFRDFLASVGNKDSITGNRLFDRYKAVEMVKAAAKSAEDSFTVSAKDGDIYKYLVRNMSKNGMGLRLRREQYKTLTHQAPAE